MTALALKPACYEDILNLPENMVGEILNGQLETHPRPAPKHLLAASSIGSELENPFQKGRGGPGGWWILDEPECHIEGETFVPDLAGWRKERMPKMPETAWFEVVPDWACEVISPSSVRRDRVTKMAIYARLGIAHLWLIDPIAQTLEAYQLHEGYWRLLASYADAQAISIAPFAEHTFLLSVLWE